LNEIISQGTNQDDHILKTEPSRKKKRKGDNKSRNERINKTVQYIFFPFSILFYLTIPNLRKGNISMWKFFVTFVLLSIYLVAINALIMWLEVSMIKKSGKTVIWFPLSVKSHLVNLFYLIYNFQFMKGSKLHAYFLSSFQELELFKMVTIIPILTTLSYFSDSLNHSSLGQMKAIWDGFLTIVVMQILLLIANLIKEAKSIQCIIGSVMVGAYIFILFEMQLVINLL